MKIPYHNHTDHYQTIGTTLIPPGETREVDATLIHGYMPAEAGLAESNPPTHIVDVLLAGPLPELLAAIPTLAHEDLELLGEREQGGAGRSEVLRVIAERLLDSASTALGVPGGEQGAEVAEAAPQALEAGKAKAKK